MSSVTIQRIWWLNPAYLFALVVGSTMALAIAQTDQNYALYNTPKYLTSYHGVLATGAIIVFVLGCQLALSTGRTPNPIPARAIPFLKNAVFVLFALTLFGYAVWLIIGIKNGFSLSVIRDVLLGDDAGSVYEIATDMFANVSGITTCTQFAMAAMPLGIWLYSSGYRKIIWLLGAVLCIATARAFILSERLSLVELVVPSTIVLIRQYIINKRFSSGISWGVNGAPFLGVVALLVFFGSAEYLRSWKLYQKDFDSVASFTIWRISGYYTTAHNNSAMALETKANYDLPYYTVQSLWAFPGISKLPIGYQHLTGIDAENQHLYMLERYGTEELNNPGGLFVPALDFGILGLFVYWFAIGFVSGRIYRSFMVGSIAGITLYPLFFLAILEVPRLLYIPNQRVFPSLVAIVFIIWMVNRYSYVPIFRKSNAISDLPMKSPIR